MLTEETLTKLSEMRLHGLASAFAQQLDDDQYTELSFAERVGVAPLADQERRDLLEVLEDRWGNRSTLVASQLPVSAWHKIIGEPTVADAIVDRLVHNAHCITLQGESMRKTRSPLTPKKARRS